MAESTIFPNFLLTKDEMYKKLFQDTENPVLDALTQECLEMINCICALMITSQLKSQLPGGKCYNPSQSVRDDLITCPSTNTVSESDFAQFDQKLKQNSPLSTISACRVIMFNNNKTSDWLSSKSKEELEKVFDISRKNKHNRIRKYKK